MRTRRVVIILGVALLASMTLAQGKWVSRLGKTAAAPTQNDTSGTWTDTYSDNTGKPLIKLMQVKLYLLGFYTGPMNGLVTTSTQTAIRSYKKSNGLTVNGRLDQALKDSLNSRL
jgi:peptidoglycan hydrolase-like protein with peptidoglycan-binding domain